MNELSQIKESIRKIAGQHRSQLVFTAKVESVDGEKCSISIDGLTITDVRLRSVINGENSKILVTPEQGSYVLVIDISGGDLRDLAVIGYSQIEKIEVDANDKIIFNGGSNHGLIQIDKLTQKLNDLVNAFNNHTHSGNFEGTIADAPATGNVTIDPPPNHPQFDKSYYEDTNVTH